MFHHLDTILPPLSTFFFRFRSVKRLQFSDGSLKKGIRGIGGKFGGKGRINVHFLGDFVLVEDGLAFQLSIFLGKK